MIKDNLGKESCQVTFFSVDTLRITIKELDKTHPLAIRLQVNMLVITVLLNVS